METVIEGLVGLPPDQMHGLYEQELYDQEPGELAILPSALELRGPGGSVRLGPLRRATWAGLVTDTEPLRVTTKGIFRSSALLLDHGDDPAGRVCLTLRPGVRRANPLEGVLAAVESLVPEMRLSLGWFREAFLHPELLAIIPVGPYPAELEDRIRFSDLCIGCGALHPSRMELPWYVEAESSTSMGYAGTEVTRRWAWPRLSIPICAPCHRFGLFELFALEIESRPDRQPPNRVLVRLPSMVAYEPFRKANKFDPDAWLTIPSGSGGKQGTLERPEADARLEQGMQRWKETEDRFGLHRYLRIKAELRLLSTRRGIRRKPLFSADEIQTALRQFAEQEHISMADYHEVGRLMNERIDALK